MFSEERQARRRAAVPVIKYPEQLPISQRREDIAQAIRGHQVVVVAGETGSGKTTQLPKICLELGRGIRGTIGHTQPRRLAARTVAERIAEELNTSLGTSVGYQVRFTQKATDDTLIKLMTDGILLNEISHDHLLRRYDTLIIDEAHERSLNIDFILGYLKRLLPRRPDLKVIITSATIDPQRFADHFDNAPIIEVSGRMYPVETRWRPDPATDDQVQGIVDAVDELFAEPPGDILVFLSGEREIRDTADALRKRFTGPRARPPEPEILPLYSRLSAAEQHRVFEPHEDQDSRRIVLATNVAETSLTVPGIRYVIDPGSARISRYSRRTKVQRLPIESISQASARQRAGRCGRVADGICIRLYSEEDFDNRSTFTEPEILRTNLASVILQMTALDLGDIAAFPFVDPPDQRAVADGVALLRELGALKPGKKGRKGHRLTALGRKLAQLPIEPRLGRMILEADQNGCLREILIIVAGLAIQDPRERVDGDDQHKRFDDPTSDFLSYLNLWRYLQEQQKAHSSNQFRKMCRRENLHYLRVREWQDLVGQLKTLIKPLKLSMNSVDGTADNIHRSILAGLLSHIGVKDGPTNDYLGARGARFAVFPGSGLFKKPPRWVMAAELVETSRLWARINAQIKPEWVEPLAQHLVKRTYSEPHWSKKAGAAIAHEKVLLYGVPIVDGRKVSYGRIDPDTARDLFIRHGLVEGDWQTHHRFFHDNRALIDDVESLEHRARRRDILVDDETLYDFYDQRIPADVVSAQHFDTWWKKARHDNEELLNFSRSLLINDEADDRLDSDYPHVWHYDDLKLSLTYQFDPGSEADGVTVHVPLAALNQISGRGFDWQVPGLRQELVVSLIKSLPKRLRRQLVPAPDTADDALAALETELDSQRLPTHDSAVFTGALGHVLQRLRGASIPKDAWDWARVPNHLTMTFRVEDGSGKRIAEGKDVGELQEKLSGHMRNTIAASTSGVERTGLTTWAVGTIPRVVSERRSDVNVTGYPALVDEDDTVALRVLAGESEQANAMLGGLRRLLLLTIGSPVSVVRRQLSHAAKLALSDNPSAGVSEILDDCIACALNALIAQAGGLVWREDDFTTLRDKVRADLVDTVLAVVSDVERILRAAHQVRRALLTMSSPGLAESRDEATEHLDHLVKPGFAANAGRGRLSDLHRYVRGLSRRLEKLPSNPQRDLEQLAVIDRVTDAYYELLDALPTGEHPTAEHERIGWMIEELRVSLFAQEVGTAHPVSEKRILRFINALR